jgi:lipoate-protein ligase A
VTDKLMSSGLKWRVIRDGPCAGPHNMALDHALAVCSQQGQGVLRLYSWMEATVSFGRNEPARGLYDRANAADQGIEFVRRPTGGRAVLHSNEVTYAIVVPVRALGGPKASYVEINRGLAEGLSSIGAAVTVTDHGETLSPDAGACFGVPAPGEIIAGEKKLVGSAQLRVGDALLQHGSIIIDGDQSLLNQLTGKLHDIVRPATLRSVLGVVDQDQVAFGVIDGLKHVLGGSWEEGEYLSGERTEAGRLERQRYSQAGWTWRR